MTALTTLLAGLLGCASPTGDTGALAGPSLAGVDWVLEVSTEGLHLDGDGVGWSAVTTEGWTVHVEEAWLASWGVSLVPCEGLAAARPAPLPLQLLGGGLAWAGHSEDGADPSSVILDAVEDLATPGPLRALGQRFDAADYCRVHYVTGHAHEGSAGLPEGDDLIGLSLAVVGNATSPEGLRVPIELQLDDAYGRLDDLELLLEAWPDDARVARITLTRSPARMFDGVDWSTADPDDAAWRVMGNLVEDSALTVSLTAADDGLLVDSGDPLTDRRPLTHDVKETP